ncbi:helix-turn-helix transcriptional regulator [Leucobacter coleopterorum]|uniref:Helix-turn-helix transcriptional regulator n=1 Tax=Leucobacter coleopterorum TaxID=2714933 RepID=A0ABX6JX47_9MICO|nr:helix-turn-helix transcriptional regulator [Leucobacter coleopterorum]QIM18881.1 helix-turn-helix transcriptional regulator [Leucobacter coleopterorum]
MAYVARSEELAACKTAVLQGLSIDIVGRLGSGRSELIKALTAELLDAGRKVVTIAGYSAATKKPFRALELAGFGTDSQSPIAALLKAVADHPSIITVDDANLLDEDSWAALAAVHTELGTPFVISRVQEMPSEGHSDRSVRSLASSTMMLRLEPLTFEATTELLLERLGGPAELDVLSRVYRKSGGLPGLVTAIADTALLSGRLSQKDQVWSMTGEFWDGNLTGSVKHLLSGLTRSQMDLIEAIGLFGSLSLDVALDIVGEEELESLEASEVIAIASTDARTKLALDPPLIGEWVRHEPSSLRRRRVTEALKEKLPASKQLTPAATPRVDSALSTANSALGVTVAHERANRLSIARDAWKADGDFTNGLRLLQELHASPSSPEEIEDVYTALSEEEGVPADRAEYRQLRMHWLAYRLNRPEDAIKLAIDLPPELLPYSEYLCAVALRVQIDAFGVPEDVDDQLAQMRRPDQFESGWVDISEAFVRIVQGKPLSALDVLNRVTPPPQSELASMHELMYLWARMGNGDVTWGFEASMKLLNAALERFDLTLTRAYALPAATCLHAVGHYGAGESLLGAVLTLGPPAVGQERTHVALLSYAAVFSCLGGHLTLADSLTREAERPAVPPSPFPSATAGQARASLQNLAGDRSGAVRSLVESFKQLNDRGYLLSAVDGGLISGAMMGIGDLLPTIYPLIDTMEGEWRSRYLDYIMAVAKSDVVALESSTAHLVDAGRLAAAQFGATELRRLYVASQDKPGIERADKLIERVVRLRDDIDVSAAAWLYGKHFRIMADLSSREQEIARLAAKGLSNQAIADHLILSLRTVETHLSAAYRKLGIRNRADLLELNWDWDA